MFKEYRKNIFNKIKKKAKPFTLQFEISNKTCL